jgi:ADP-heptose:LPS heptosyltransferase
MAAASNASVAAGAALPAIPEIKVSPESITRMRDFLATRSTKGDAGQKLVLLHPGTSKLAIEKGIIKTWDTKNWCELIRLLQADSTCVPILVGGPDDQSIIQEINAIMAPNEPPFISAVGHTKSLADLAALTKLCDLLVCVDSAPMHIAVGTGTPVVAMFGPTDENKLLPKNPCFKALRDPTASTPTLAVRGVQLPPHDVYRSVLDQLKVSTNQENCQELHR